MLASDTLRQDANLLFDAVREAGKLGLSLTRQPVASWNKPDGSQVSEADLKINQLFEETLKPARPYGWLSEETPDDDQRLAHERLWIIDPIDGTRSFIEKTNDWCVAAALIDGGRPVAAAVYRPTRNEFYNAIAGEGAYLNGHKLAVTDSPKLAGARLMGNRKALEPLQTSGIASGVGSALPLQLRLAYVAAGRLDGAVSAGNRNDWDLAAGELLVFEAGGMVSGLTGTGYVYNRPKPWQHGLVAAGARRHAAIINALRNG